MKKLLYRAVATVIVVLMYVLPALADRSGHYRHGSLHGHYSRGASVVIGGGWLWPGWWAPYPYYPYYPRPPVIVQPPPEIEVQPAPVEEEPEYLYFCPDPQGYYPKIERCPKGWLKVVPPETPLEIKE
jgi:hypothetical protein